MVALKDQLVLEREVNTKWAVRTEYVFRNFENLMSYAQVSEKYRKDFSEQLR